ncbi:hypothetical protein [Usitatibacter rugosus]|uniref:hypothetical protein n=1 Tax=Usitatibacter rugosus TaxID=2732067 RepID=UPI001BB270D8|nr:hypothetical protein [Usitatibacter rugosus]
MIEQCGWANRSDLEAGTTAKQLLSEIEEFLPYLGSHEPWLEAMQTDSLSRELEALVQLVFLDAARSPSEHERLFAAISAMESEPEWLLIHRLAAALCLSLGISFTTTAAQVPALLCGEEA